MLLLLLACPSPTEKPQKEDPPTESATDSSVDSPLPDCEESAGAAVEEAAFPWQSWDDGAGAVTMADFGSVTGADGSTTYDLSATPGWEAVRLELDHPSKIHALRVNYGMLPSEQAPVTLGLYPDFGHNGFDYWIDQPLWTGTRCLSAEDQSGWVTYKVDPPLLVDGPALVYAASYRDGDNGPMLWADAGTGGDGSCGAWDDCHSSIRYPLADKANYFTGLSFPLQYDFLVQAQVETISTIPAEDKWFQAADAGLPPSGNIAWGDYDDDGDDDIMLAGPSLYRNDGGTFTDVSVEAGVQVGIGTAGGVWGDFDNDGCLDFYGMNGSRDAGPAGNELLLRSNCDGTFSDVTALAGIDDLQESVDCLNEGTPQHSPTYGAAWGDFDNDGLLDLVQANFLCFDDYTYYPDRFWHNNGDGTFSEWGEEHGFEWDALAGRGAMALDADLDGDIDIAINNYVLQKNLYYRNMGDGMFEERASLVGLAGSFSRGYFGHTIGMAFGDLDNDGDFDSVHANLAHPRYYEFSDLTQLLIQNSGSWVDEAADRGLEYHETHSNPSLLDFENDGDLDLTISEVYAGRPTDVYVNDGTAHFLSVREEAGFTTENGWGTAVSDYDNDGDEDIMLTTLFRNDVATGHYLKLRLVGDVDSNRAAIGAVARVTAGGKTWLRTVSGGNGVGNQDSQTLHVGLGSATTIDNVEVWFPGGGTHNYTGLQVDRSYRLTESGTVTEGLGR